MRTGGGGGFAVDCSQWCCVPTARPLGWGIVVAVAFIVAEAGLVLSLKRTAPDNSYGAIFLLGVLVVAAGWNFGLALATSLASAAVYVYFHVEDGDNLVPAFFVFLPLALLASVLASQARLRAAESEERRREAERAGPAAGRAAPGRHPGGTRREPADLYPVAVTELARGLGLRTRHADRVRRRRSQAWYWPRTTCPAGRNFKWGNDFRSTATA